MLCVASTSISSCRRCKGMEYHTNRTWLRWYSSLSLLSDSFFRAQQAPAESFVQLRRGDDYVRGREARRDVPQQAAEISAMLLGCRSSCAKIVLRMNYPSAL